MRWTSLIGLCLACTWGCSSSVESSGSGDGAGGAGATSGTGATTSTGGTGATTSTGGTGAGIGVGGEAGHGGEGGTIPCPGPEDYPEDCSLIGDFQCGFEYSCDGATLHVAWHEHVMCSGSEGNEEIYSYSCSFECAEACDPAYPDWPSSGAILVEAACVTGGSGGGGGAGGSEG